MGQLVVTIRFNGGNFFLFSTKHITRFRSPFVNESVTKLSRLREQLQIDCEEAWIKFLGCVVHVKVC